MRANASLDVRGLIGRTADGAYSALLLSYPTVTAVTVFTYASPPPLQSRVAMSEAEHGIVDHALQIRSATRMPFWSAVFSACVLREEHSPLLLKEAFFHNGPGAGRQYQRRDLEAGILGELTAHEDVNLGLSSEVRDERGQCWHLGFLDFHCDISECNTNIVRDVCRIVMPSGFLLLDSGDSYHACAIDLLSPEERTRMLGKALLASPIVDAHYIAHQLHQASSSIRISKGGRARKRPTVIDAWRPTAQ